MATKKTRTATKAKGKPAKPAKRAKTAKPKAAVRPKAAASQKAPAKPSARELGKTVDDYVRELEHSWQRDAITKIRGLVKRAAPSAKESIKWGQPVYEQGGPFAYIKAFDTALNFGFWRGVSLKDPGMLLSGDGERMRHVKLVASSWKTVPGGSLESFVREAVALNARHGDPTKG